MLMDRCAAQQRRQHSKVQGTVGSQGDSSTQICCDCPEAVHAPACLRYDSEGLARGRNHNVSRRRQLERVRQDSRTRPVHPPASTHAHAPRAHGCTHTSSTHLQMHGLPTQDCTRAPPTHAPSTCARTRGLPACTHAPPTPTWTCAIAAADGGFCFY